MSKTALAVRVDVPGLGCQEAKGSVAAMICWLLANADDIYPCQYVQVTLHVSDAQLTAQLQKHYPKVQLS